MFQVGCDNDKYGENIWTNSKEELLHFTYKEDLPPKKGFRGFVLTPRVLCERFDITGYLNKQKMKNVSCERENSVINSDIKLLQQCSVILVRQDLQHLKKKFNKNFNKSNKYCMYTNTPMKCKVCEKVYTSEKRLKNHVEAKHTIVYSKSQKRVSFSDEVIVHELKEYHYCRKCPKVYEDYQTLKRHMKLVHKKRKSYICFYCNKEFVDRMFFKVHIKMHCNMCGKFFNNGNQYNNHRRTVCRILKKYNCKTCNETYFSFLSLKDHSYEHEGVIFVCDICKERCNSKCLLLHHIQFLHCKKQPKTLYDTKHIGTNVTYECNSCDHCSSNKEVIENHTTVLPDLKDSLTTGYKDYYFCDQCYEQFDTETKMLRHKWTHFLHTQHNESHNNIIKTNYKINEKLPIFLQPNVVLEKFNLNNSKTSDTATNNKSTNIMTNNVPASIIMRDNVPASIIMTDNVPASIIMTDNVPPSGTLSNAVGNVVSHEAPTNHSNTNINYIVKEADGTEYMKKIEVLPSKIKLNRSKPGAEPCKRKTIISKHQCLKCGNYYSSGYCLRRHISQVHNKNNLKCPKCEEVFASLSLLQSHNCIRMTTQHTSFEDLYLQDIQFNNPYNNISNENANIPSEDMNTSNDMDYDMPAPIVELTEYDDIDLIVSNEGSVSFKGNIGINIDNIKYVVTMQEVPIEF